MLARLSGLLAATLLIVACTGAASTDEILVPTREDVWAHQINLIEPVRRAHVDRMHTGVGVRLSVSRDGRVLNAEARPDQRLDEGISTDVVREAVANARAATFEPFTRDGAPAEALVDVYVPLLEPERRPSRTVAFPDVAGQSVTISLKRTACFGTCPDYTVNIDGDGAVTFQGNAFVALEGVHRSRVSPQAVQALLDMFRQADFFSLDDEYIAPITDNPTRAVSLTIGDRTKTVTDYAGSEVGMPFSVERLEHAIDRLAGTQRWVRGDDTTAESLAAEGYDFTSSEAGAALRRFAWNDAGGAARDFLAKGAPLTGPTNAESFDGPDGTALEAAASNGDAGLMRAIIDRDRAAARRDAERVLDRAASSLNLASLNLALGLGDFSSQRLGVALAIAMNGPNYKNTESDQAPVFNRLIGLHADVNAVNKDGQTPLHGANTPALVRRLVALGANIEARDSFGETPVVSAHDEDVALALLDAGANPDVKPTYGQTLREQAVQYGWRRVLARLGRRGGKVSR